MDFTTRRSVITLFVSILTWFSTGSVAIAQSPVADFTSDITSGCFPITVNFEDLSSNSPTSWAWNFGNGNTSTFENPSAVYSFAGDYTVTLIACNGSGCDTIINTQYITAYDYPIADFAANITYGCAPLLVQFTDLSIPISSSIVWWYWDFGDGFSSTSPNPTHAYFIPGIYNVSISITDSLGCNDSKSITNYIIVSVPPTLSYTATPATSCFAPLNTTFTNTTTQGTYPVSSWFWNFGDGFSSTSANPVHNYTSSGSFTVSLTAVDSIGCSSIRIDSNAIVVGNDSASFTYSTVRTCSSLDVSFFGAPNPNFTNWSWDFGDGSPTQTGQNINHSYTTTGTFTVVLTTTNVGGCTDTASTDISFQLLTGGFTADTTYGCSLPFNVNYSGSAVGTPPYTWAWDFSYEQSMGFMNESTLQNPSYAYTYEDTFDVKMIVTDAFGCTDEMTLMGSNDSIWVLRSDPNFFRSPWQGCAPLSVSFTDNSVVYMGSIASWAWNFDDPVSGSNNTSSLQNPAHTFDSVGVYSVTLTMTNTLGCIESVTRTVRTGYPPLADSITISKDTACHGEPVLLEAFSTDTNINGGMCNFGDGYSGSGWPAISHEFQDTGLITISLRPVYNGCPGDTLVYGTIYILPPKPIFTATPVFSCTPPLTVTFTNTSWDADSSSWDFGDGTPLSTTVSPVHIYTTPGRHVVWLTVTNVNGCLDSDSTRINIPQPTANFSATPTVGCTPLTVNFTDFSFNYISLWVYRIVSWSWDFGDGNVSSQRYPIHTYTTTGSFTVTLTITDAVGCTHTLVKTDEIITSATTAEFTASPTVGCEPLTVTFTDQSIQYSPILSWSWDFGDGSPLNSTPSPTHDYISSGSYDVVLTVTDSIGCVNTMTKSSYVNLTKPNPQFTHPARVCKNESTSFINTTSGSGLSYLWDFGDLVTTTSQNPFHSYSDTGLYTVTLIATDSNGCSDTGTSQIECIGQPVINFSVDSFFAVCPPLIVQFNDFSTNANDTIINWLWDFGDSNSTTAQNPVHTFVNIGSYDVQLTATNTIGCVGTAIILDMITVAGPTGYFDFSPDTGCVPFTVSFSAVTNNVTIYHWDFGNGIVDTVSGSSISHTYFQPGYPIPQLALTDSAGCKLPATSPVPSFLAIDEVFASFSLFPEILYTPFCPADTIFFTDSSYSVNDSALITGWAWDFGDGNSSTAQNPVHTYNTPGTYTVSLTATSSLGCSNTITDTVQIILNDTLVLVAIITDFVPASCFNGADGQATADGLSGTPPYSFLWGALTGNQSTPTATGLIAGTHSVMVTDSNGCTDSIVVLITEPDSMYFIIDSMTSVSCNGFSDGSLAVSATGGTAPYTYQWDVAAGSQTNTLATGLSAGGYLLTVTDTNGCTFSDTATVTEPDSILILIDTTDVLCNGADNGTATANLTGGTSPYTYLWSPSAGNQTTATATGLVPGTHSVTVSDSNACIDSAFVTITEPAVLNVITNNISNVSCNGLSDGTIDVLVTGGTTPYYYLWDAAAGNQTSSLAGNLIAGGYTITVTDTNGCVATHTDTVTEPTAIVISINTSGVSCNGGNDGTATASPTGGIPSYAYQWGALTGNQTTATAVGLSAGTYSVTVTDSTGCNDSATAVVNEPALLSFVIDSVSDPSCTGFTDGSIWCSATGGTAPYSYLWDAAAGNQTTAVATNLIAGDYVLTVTDSNGCSFADTTGLTDPPPLLISIDTTAVLCNGGSDGTATAIPSGGTQSYTYLWGSSAGSQTNATASGLSAGTHSVTITDANNCIVDTQIVISEPPQLSVDIIELNSSLCFGTSNGELDVLVLGGVPTYSYLWQPGNFTFPNINNLAPGSYILTISDANNCQASDTAVVVELMPLEVALEDDTVCYFANYALGAQPTGSAPPYTYSWTNGISTFTGNPINITPSVSELWTVTVTDSAGCVTAGVITLYVNELAVSLTFPDTVCYGDLVTIVATASGSLSGFNSNYSYIWNTAHTTSSIQVPINNTSTFMVTVTDGCSKSTNGVAVVNIFTFPNVGIKTTGPACPFEWISHTDTINGFNGATYEWDFGDGNFATGLSVQHQYTNGGYYYPSVTVTSSIGCSRTYTTLIPVIIYATPNVWFEPDLWAAPFDDPIINFWNASWITPIDGDIIESYFWEFGDGNTDTLVNASNTFPTFGYYSVTLTATTNYGCEGQVTREIRILEPDIDLLIPTAFTPNPSGSSAGNYDPTSFDNDVFFPITSYVDEFFMQIYNRWGELIFESTDHAIGWDGYYRSVLSQQDTYMWKMKIIWITGREFEDVGRILLIR